MASSDGAYGEVELHPSRKFADPRLSALVEAAQAEMVAGANELFATPPQVEKVEILTSTPLQN